MKHWILMIFVLVTAVTKAQTINGVVLDENNEPLPFASVSLLQASDSVFILGITTDENGTFKIADASQNKILRISYVGYSTMYITPTSDMKITLSKVGLSVGNIVITGKRPIFKYKGGGLVAPVENTVLSKLGDGIDVLQQLPFINGNGNQIHVLGKQGIPLVYINNRRMLDWSELRQLPSNMIKDVKIIMNPGIQYDSSISAVIHITTLRPTNERLGGYSTLEVGKGDDTAYSEKLFLNYRKKKTDVFISGNFAKGVSRGLHNEYYSFIQKNKEYQATGEGEEKNSHNKLNLYAGFNHQPTTKQYLSMQYMYNTYLKHNTHMALKNSFIGESENSLFRSIADGSNPSSRQSLSAYYSNHFNDALSLRLDGILAHIQNTQDNIENEDRTGLSVTMNTTTETKSDVYAMKAIITGHRKKGNINLGIEHTYTRSDLAYKTNLLDYNIQGFESESKQLSTSLFANYQMTIGAFSADVGLRYNLTDFNYYKNGLKRNDDCKKYRHLFPNLSLSYQKRDLSAAIGYKVTVERPSYSNLQSGTRYINSYTYAEGNSLLRPSYIHDISVMLVYKDFLAMFDYYNIKDADYQVLNLYQDQPIIIFNRDNFNHHAWMLNMSYSATVSFWKPTFQIGVTQQDLNYLNRHYNTPIMNYSWKNVLSFQQNWTVVFNMNGHTKGDAQFYTSKKALISNTDIYLNKRIKDWTIRVGMKDIFHTYKDDGYEKIGNITHRHWTDLRQQYMYIRCTYRFNSTRSKYKGGDAGQHELQRL